MTVSGISIGIAIDQWRGIVGPDDVIVGDDIHRHYPACTTASTRHVPAVIRVRRASPDELDDQYIESKLLPILRIATANGVAVHPISSGNNWGYGTWLPADTHCVVLDMSGIDRIIDLDLETGVVTLEPGVTQGALAHYLASRGNAFMVPVTGAGPTCSVLANALERGYGITPISDHFASMFALEALLVDGTHYRSPMLDLLGRSNGTHFKWGLGPYLDGLFSQSGFGIVTRMRIALARRPDCIRVMVMPIRSAAALGEVVSRVRLARSRLPGLIGGINLLNAHRALAMSAPYPWDELSDDGLVTPDAIARLQRKYGVADWMLFGTLYGTKRTQRAAQKELNEIFTGLHKQPSYFSHTQLNTIEAVAKTIPIDRVRQHEARRVRMLRMATELAMGMPNETALPLAYWRMRSSGESVSPLNPARDGCGLIWYAPLVPMTGGAVAKFVDFITETLPRFGLEPLITMTTVNDHCFDASIPLLFDRSCADAVERAKRCYSILLDKGLALGFAPYRVPVDALAEICDRTTSHGQLTLRLKRAVDPFDLLSPGRYCLTYGKPSIT